jgi:hypothetical protein
MKRALYWGIVGFALSAACGVHLLWALAITVATTLIGAIQ